MKYLMTVITGGLLVIFLLSLLTASYFFSQGACSIGTFSCKESDTCVPQRAICNGHNDCPGGEDESAATCGDFHGSSYVMDVLKNVNFTPNPSHLCEHKGLPEGCNCKNHHWVYCKEMNLTEIPRGIEGNLSRLILANNSISHPKRYDLSGYNLKLLHLEGNCLHTLDDDLFVDQTRLEKLLLMNNQIQFISGKVFRGLISLSMMYLQKNLVSFIDANAFKDLISLRYLDLSDNKLTAFEAFPHVPYLLELILDRNQITEFYGHEFDHVRSLHYLGLSGNNMRQIHLGTLASLTNLSELDLSHNKLTVLDEDLFQSNCHLKKLFLGFNPMRFLSKSLLSYLHNLHSLDLADIEFETMSADLFDDLPNLDFIYFKWYYYCTFVPRVMKCSPKSDGLSTFEDLLGRSVLRLMLWTVAVTSWLGNSFVFYGRINSTDENKSLSWIVRNLAVSDFLMGVYLGVIGWKDLEYRGIYHLESNAWMMSWLCSAAGAMAMLSSEVSLFILVFMSVERFLIIAIPFTALRPLSHDAAYRCLAAIWIVGICIAICPIIVYRSSTHFYGANAMCFPLHLDDPFFAGWQFSAIVFLGINSAGLLILTAMYLFIFISVLRTRKNTTVMEADFDLAIRFFFIVLTNTACLLPVILLKILAFYRVPISSSAYAWIAIVVVPVNSAFNPILYTFTTPKYRDIVRKIIFKKNPSPKNHPHTFSSDTCSNDSTHPHHDWHFRFHAESLT